MWNPYGCLQYIPKHSSFGVTLYLLQNKTDTFANIVDPDEKIGIKILCKLSRYNLHEMSNLII